MLEMPYSPNCVELLKIDNVCFTKCNNLIISSLLDLELFKQYFFIPNTEARASSAPSKSKTPKGYTA
jgi:hypothetical protein